MRWSLQTRHARRRCWRFRKIDCTIRSNLALDKNILTLYTKSQRTGRRSPSRKTAKSKTNGTACALSGTPQTGMWSSAAGPRFGRRERAAGTGHASADRRHTEEWVDTIGEVFDAMERERGSGLGSSGTTEPYGRGRHVHWQITQ